VGILKISTSKICRSQIGKLQSGTLEAASSDICRTNIRSIEIFVVQLDTLKERAADIDPHQRYSIFAQLLQGIYSPSGTSFALSRVNDLPRLVMLLLDPVSAFREVGNHREKNRKGADVFEHFEKSPSTKPIHQPSTRPLQPLQWNEKRVPGVPMKVRQRCGRFSLCVNEHFGNLDNSRRQVKHVLLIHPNSPATRSESGSFERR